MVNVQYWVYNNRNVFRLFYFSNGNIFNNSGYDWNRGERTSRAMTQYIVLWNSLLPSCAPSTFYIFLPTDQFIAYTPTPFNPLGPCLLASMLYIIRDLLRGL